MLYYSCIKETSGFWIYFLTCCLQLKPSEPKKLPTRSLANQKVHTLHLLVTVAFSTFQGTADGDVGPLPKLHHLLLDPSLFGHIP